MPEKTRTYAAIDLKSFYASVECMHRDLDPLTTNLVVADASRTEKTICLAVTPSLRSLGIPGRARLFEVIQKVKEINAERLIKAPGHYFTGESSDSEELKRNPSLKLSYVVAVPRMAEYIRISTQIYSVYLSFAAPEDIHVYSIDEVFMDLTDYLHTYGLPPKDLVSRIIRSIYDKTGITATAGIGTNLYLAKVAMDILAKHIAPDANGVRIAELDEYSYRKLLWGHRPLTDFWRVGPGISSKLEENGLFTMGDIALCSKGKNGDFFTEDLLYRLFGVNAELLIDHAWGYEPCSLKDIQAYKPESSSVGSGQVLHEPYSFEKARLIIREMTDLMVMDLVDQQIVTDQITLTIGYDIDNLSEEKKTSYRGEVKTDRYGRKVPKSAHGSINLGKFSSSTKLIIDKTMELYDRITDPNLLIRRVNVTANHICPESDAPEAFRQFDLFTDPEVQRREMEEENRMLEKEKKLQKAALEIRKKFGKNAILKGMNLQEGATTIERNSQIGGHKG